MVEFPEPPALNQGKSPILKVIIMALIGYFILTFLLQSAAVTPVMPAQTVQHDLSDAKWKMILSYAEMLKESMREPESFKLNQVIVINKTGAACIEYRGRNGFGGVNVEHAVLARDGLRFKTEQMPDFPALWDKECLGKTGTDKADQANMALDLYSRYTSR